MTSDHKVRETVRDIWAAVLRAEVGDSADFFDLGGHSFAAVQIVTRMNQELPLHTSVTALLDNPRFDHFVGVLTREA